ncbi:ClpP-like prohead protease/major capsid protein fusion protein [Escherichia coli]|uniref:ClpP-like prohead protease/major capsid protein fusion protein n=1 Tax=Escherichia coli TaxID=562 RepID=UPI00208DB22B|nr:ClpP-like prohead protease/major capsid protein fusion protein [Escherichia coli]
MEISLYEPIEGVTARQFRDSLMAAKGPVTVAINSGGGNVTDGMAMFNALRTYKGHTVARIDGIAASMATIVALGARRVVMADNGWWMIHNPWGVFVGESEDLRKKADMMEKIGKAMLDTYVAKTGLPESEIKAMMDAETWLTAEEAKEKGFIDEIYPAEGQALAMAPGCGSLVEKFTRTPESIIASVKKGDTESANEREKRKKEAGILFGHWESSLCGWLPGIVEEFISGSITAEEARKKHLEKLAEDITPCAGSGAMNMYAGNGNIVGDSVKAALMARSGLADVEKDNRYNGYSLRELARASLVDRGVSGIPGNPLGMVGMAFTHSSSDFGGILADVAHKSLLKGWEDSPETFHAWTKKGTLTDFKVAHRVGMDGFKSLRKVLPGSEYKYASTSDRSEPIALATYGELFSIDRQAIINDDMSALTSIPQQMGAAASRTVGDLVYAVLVANQRMGDKNPLFDAKHSNLINSELDIPGLSAARKAMRMQKNNAGAVLNIPPRFLLVPVELEDRATQLIRSTSLPDAQNSGVFNPYNDALTVITEARLDADSVKSWYLLAGQGSDTIEVAYLDGIDTPYLEQQQGFTVDGVTFKVRIDAGVSPLDWRGMVKSSGG